MFGDPVILRDPNSAVFGDPVILRDPSLRTKAHAHYQSAKFNSGVLLLEFEAGSGLDPWSLGTGNNFWSTALKIVPRHMPAEDSKMGEFHQTEQASPSVSS